MEFKKHIEKGKCSYKQIEYMFIEYYPTSKAYKSYTLCNTEILYNTAGHMPMIMMMVMDSCGRRLFSGARIWLRMTFNYPVLWVRVKGQG